MWQTLVWFRNVCCVFTFVAVWHDMTLQLLVWGWLSAIAFVPEALVEWLGSLPVIRARVRDAWWLSNLIALLGAMNVLLLIVANMLGFATAATADGSGAAAMLSVLATRHGLLLLGGATITLWVLLPILKSLCTSMLPLPTCRPAWMFVAFRVFSYCMVK